MYVKYSIIMVYGEVKEMEQDMGIKVNKFKNKVIKRCDLMIIMCFEQRRMINLILGK